MTYDPDIAPDAIRWLATSEAARLAAVREHHETIRNSGRPGLHAAIHVAVENQLAESHPAATAAMDRLIAGGLTRHEAVHAVGSVLSVDLVDMMRSGRLHDPDTYSRKLQALTAEGWRTGKDL